MMKVIKIQKQSLGGTDVTLHVPEFENFGKRLDELERLAEEANPISPEEIKASTAQLMDGARGLHEKAQRKLESMPAGPEREMHEMMLEMLEQMQKRVNLPEEGEDREEQEADAEEAVEPQHDLQHLELSVPKGMKWDGKTRNIVEQFFADWPQTRPLVLQALFDYYKRIYPDALTLFPGHKGLKFILPKPSAPKAIADLFNITSIYLHRNGAIGLSGNCTWDEEHGYGLLLKNGKVTAVGQADEAFS